MQEEKNPLSSFFIHLFAAVRAGQDGAETGREGVGKGY